MRTETILALTLAALTALTFGYFQTPCHCLANCTKVISETNILILLTEFKQ